MNLKKLFIFILLSVGNYALSMEIQIGKKYRNKETGEIVTIKEDKSSLAANGLINVESNLQRQLIVAYFKKCCYKSNKSHLLQTKIPLDLYEGKSETIKRYINEEYYGRFYYAENQNNKGECVHESWLEPVEN